MAVFTRIKIVVVGSWGRELKFTADLNLIKLFKQAGNFNTHPQLSHTTILIHQNPSPLSAREEHIQPIFVASEQRLDVSAKANIQPAATKVTNIGCMCSSQASAS